MRSARAAAFAALLALEKGKSSRLKAALDRRGLSAADSALSHELASGVERTRLFLDFVIARAVDRGAPRDPHVRTALRLGAYQLLRLSRVPAYAAVDETISLLQRGRGFGNAVLRRIAGWVQPRPADPSQRRREVALDASRALVFEADCLPDPETEHAAYHALLHGLPAFVVARWESFYGAESAAALAAAADRTPVVMLRAMRRHGDAAALREMLAAEGVETEPAAAHPDMVRVCGGASPFDNAAYRDGWFVAQDPTALRAAEAVGAAPGETVLDLCAGPGTKTAFLAEAVTPGGRVHAYDVSEARRRPIQATVSRLSAEDVVVVHDDLDAVPAGVDRVLVDVPCSNTGVLARRVEVRRRLQPDLMTALTVRQKSLLEEALRRVKSGGTVVYSTCSLEPEENEAVVELAREAGHRIERQERTFPDPPHHDGGFFAVIVAK